MGAEADEGRLGVVFVHGFLSSSETWNPITSLIAGDPALGRVDPLLFDYESRLWQPDPRRRIPTLRVVADMLKELLDSQTSGHRRLALVGHSQGGLVIQYCLARMLGEGRGKDLARIRRVVLFACPNSGTQWGAAFGPTARCSPPPPSSAPSGSGTYGPGARYGGWTPTAATRCTPCGSPRTAATC
ncbi:esterase/lipase family protein [Streptomyces goshikiensis]|uniref:esterase/lipase family protein n=1 Tax=Streptomyces goshikiensis TaxID=1942 RepID=UPI00339F2A62